MYRDIWTLAVPTFLMGAAVIGLGLALDWSNGAVGWALLGGLVIVDVIWGLVHLRRQA